MGGNNLSVKKRYRPEIDGLRAFAVITVIINHFNKEILPGGYLGVDIFFVISGFVITSSLYQRPSKNFKDFIIGFYERRIKRLVPSLSVFVLIMSIAICLFNPKPDLSLSTGLASLFGLSNLFLLKESTNYFAQSTELNVFTHTWSLSVEEQFYLLFPFLIWFSGFSKQLKNGRRNLFFIVVALTIASLIGFLYLYPTNLPAAYFLMPARFWEMSSGCLLFIGLQKRKPLKHFLKKAPPLIVLGLIVVLMLLPISWGAASTVGVVFLTCILIASLRKQTIAFNFLANPKVVFIGLISYPLYLWHWGVLSISRWTIGIHFWTLPLQFALILGLAIASFRFIETPLREGKFFNEKWKTLTMGGGILLIVSSLISMGKIFSHQVYLGKSSSERPEIYSSAESELRRNNCSILFKIPAKEPLDSCYKNNQRDIPDTLIALVGDSMAKSIYTIIDIEDSEKGLSTFYSTKNSCFFPQPASSSNNCKQWSEGIIKKIIGLSKHHSNTIIIVNGYYNYYFDKSRSIFQPFLQASNDYEGYLKAVSNLAKNFKRNGKDISLVLTMPVPMQSLNPYPHCQKEWYRVNISSNCGTGTLKKYANLNPRNIRSQFKKIASTNSNVYIFDTSNSLCPDKFCKMRNSKGILLYGDDHHLSDHGAKYLFKEYEKTKNLILK